MHEPARHAQNAVARHFPMHDLLPGTVFHAPDTALLSEILNFTQPAMRHMGITLSSTAFGDGSEIPQKHGYKHGNARPPLRIDNIPRTCKSIAIIMDDPDAMAPAGKVWVHWLAWNIPPVNEIPESSMPKGTVQGMTDFGKIGYGGPAPPDKRHTYIFKAYALDSMLSLQEGATKKELEESLRPHLLEQTVLRGTFAP